MDLKQENSLFACILVFMSSWNFMLSWVELSMKKFYNLRARPDISLFVLVVKS